MIDQDCRDATLAIKAARAGTIEVWRTVVEDFETRGLLHQVRCKPSPWKT